MLQFELDPAIQSSSGFQFPICPISIFYGMTSFWNVYVC